MTNAAAMRSGLDEMVALTKQFAPSDGIHQTPVPRLSLARYDRPHEPMPAVYPPCVCVIAQGSKAIHLATERYVYDRSRFIMASVDLPRLGRLLPGQVVRFAPVTVEEAEKLRRDQEARLQRAIADFKTARPPGGIDLVRLYEENLIDGVVY